MPEQRSFLGAGESEKADFTTERYKKRKLSVLIDRLVNETICKEKEVDRFLEILQRISRGNA